MRLFLSYASEDRSEAERIHLALIGAGHKVFFDKSSLPEGGDYVQRIRSALARADAMVFLISPDSIKKSTFALNEMQLAESRWKYPKHRLLPVLIRPTPISDIPAYLKAVTILEPIGDVSAHLLQSLTNLRPHAAKIRMTIVASGFILFVGLLSLAVPVRTFDSVKEIPPRDDAIRIETVVDRKQLTEQPPGRLFQIPTKNVDNGYFRLVIPAFAEHLVAADVRLQGGVALNSIFSPNLYLRIQLQPTRDVNTIDLHGCGLAVVFKVKSKALFFYSTEADASPKNISLNVDYSNLNTFAFRQVGSEVAAFLNEEMVGTFKAQTRPSACSPRIYIKANPGKEAEAEFQGLSIHEYAPLNVWSKRAVL